MMKSVHLNDRALIRVSGADARNFLQGLITNDIEKLAPDKPLYAALLTPQGKVIYDFIVMLDRETIFVDCAKTQATDLTARLKKYKLRAKVEIDEQGHELAVWSSANQAPKHDAFVQSVRDPRQASLGYRWIVRTEIAEQALSAMNIEFEPKSSYDRHRIECAVPDSTVDLDPESYFPLDCNFEELNGVDFNKGCYIGQELTARMKHRATSRKRILPIAAEQILPPAGTKLSLNDVEVGEVRGTQGNIGLAMIRLDKLSDAIIARAGPIDVRIGRPPYPLSL